MATSSGRTRPQRSAAAAMLVPSGGTKSSARIRQLQAQQQSTQPKPRPSVDPSVLRPSISVSFTGLKQAMTALENGSPEVRQYLWHECNIVMECRTCFNMFRSLANFIAHKRSFCTERMQDVKHIYRRDEGDFGLRRTVTTAFVEPEPVETVHEPEEFDLSSYSPSLELLKEAGWIEEIQSKPLVTTLKPSNTKKKNINSIVQHLKTKLVCGPEAKFYQDKEEELNVNLEKITQTTKAVFQTIGEPESGSMGKNYAEWQRLKQRPTVFVGPDGKVVQPGPPPTYLSPLETSTSSNSSEDGDQHSCSLCKKTFVSSYGVVRHLVNCHSLSLEEAKALNGKSKTSKTDPTFGNVRFGEEKKFRCQKCFLPFKAKESMQLHEIKCRPSPVVDIKRLNIPLSDVKRAIQWYKNEDTISKTVTALGDLAHSSAQLTLGALDQDDDPEVSFKANEDKDSGIADNSNDISDEETTLVTPKQEVKGKRRRKLSTGSARSSSEREVTPTDSSNNNNDHPSKTKRERPYKRAAVPESPISSKLARYSAIKSKSKDSAAIVNTHSVNKKTNNTCKKSSKNCKR